MLQKTILNEPETDRKTGRGIKSDRDTKAGRGRKAGGGTKTQGRPKAVRETKQNWPPVLPVSWMYWTGNTVRSTAVT